MSKGIEVATRVEDLIDELLRKLENALTLAEHHAIEEASPLFRKLLDQFTALRTHQNVEVRLLRSEKDIVDELKQVLLAAIKQEEADIDSIIVDIAHFLRAKNSSERNKWYTLIDKAATDLQRDRKEGRDVLRKLQKA